MDLFASMSWYGLRVVEAVAVGKKTRREENAQGPTGQKDVISNALGFSEVDSYSRRGRANPSDGAPWGCFLHPLQLLRPADTEASIT